MGGRLSALKWITIMIGAYAWISDDPSQKNKATPKTPHCIFLRDVFTVLM